jgi:hypothetical protein
MLGEKRNVYNNSVRKPERMRRLGRPRRRWENNVRMDLRETGWEVVDWIHRAQGQGPMAGCCEHGNEPSGPIKSEKFRD